MIIEVTIPNLLPFRERMAAAPELFNAERIAAMRDTALIAEAEIKRLTPRKTGRLFAAWHSDVSPDGSQARISDAVSYASVVEFGSAAHDIAPNRAKALSWPGAAHPVRRVRHPGTTGQHMGERGVEAAKPMIVNRFQKAIQNLLQKLVV